MAIASDAPVRHQPAGPFHIEHFWNADDKRSHIDRINPLDGKSPSDGTGAHGVHRQPELQTYNVTGEVIGAQVSVEQPAEDVADITG
jgi:hypothetical protein